MDLHLASDTLWMRRALAEAVRGVGWTSPNPAVGAVIVREGRLIARGFHRRAGGPHAEIAALQMLKSPGDARGAELFITLEPCSSAGRTPPCTDTIIAAGFSRVVFGAFDPNPLHAGHAVLLLRSAGIQVATGVLEEECLLLNEGWNKWICTGSPLVIAKAAMSLDGYISSHPRRRWITSAASRRDAMGLRSTVDAILVGGETIRTDNPRLTLRRVPPRPQPWRVVWTQKSLPPDARIFTDRYHDRTLVFQKSSLREILHSLGARSIRSVLIEGGGYLLGEALDQHVIDKFCLYYAPLFLGGRVPAFGGLGISSLAQALRLTKVRYRCIGDDVRLEAYPQTTAIGGCSGRLNVSPIKIVPGTS
ncbi:Riboflavin biosynthesis protein RibD [Candidatus Xiphinematobacter sp. Idaho Grape]|uniref:bifunctional diaminohydroxyphosphoribosylaminopyrimidine deaminase/5-amino-6-(5-phosphoribosylamino)uracil reductase RibD n=1 Tax=Candidatus Xiphinematobacter sp. Idaho Grape TaxID=1704307 RepID=UPI000706643A|nr:bifunctional diaminohydroxyphosphoribosylaminopyrimidine deaminase/5-amino-6-(5-phosphoribosylamino)uracil reductase RibD [Candidatus Xiphinematobacter sp. Idaho Grape]ALJ56819.1 Riboflavin biosynthesis protein RibD [Candidatus Xiphinematobacter sp. Idaho Grape]